MTRALLLALVLGGCVSAVGPAVASNGPATSMIPVPIYREVYTAEGPTRYYFSTRTAEEAERNGWRQTNIAFYAYVTPVPGTVPVYCETPMSAPHSDYRFSTRSEADAMASGWMRVLLAFYAFPQSTNETVPVALEAPIGAREGPFGLDVRSASEAEMHGQAHLETAFHAYDPGGITVLLDRRGVPWIR
jgi:hypothetical protein